MPHTQIIAQVRVMDRLWSISGLPPPMPHDILKAPHHSIDFSSFLFHHTVQEHAASPIKAPYLQGAAAIDKISIEEDVQEALLIKRPYLQVLGTAAINKISTEEDVQEARAFIGDLHPVQQPSGGPLLFPHSELSQGAQVGQGLHSQASLQ